jgi:hypothetical protein
MNGRALLLVVLCVQPFVPLGCVTDHRPAAYAELKTRAVFDLRCNDPSIVPLHEGEAGCIGHEYWPVTAGVQCGERQATYERVCESGDCRWLMNSAGNSARPESRGTDGGR